jgi:hypothetical protein
LGHAQAFRNQPDFEAKTKIRTGLLAPVRIVCLKNAAENPPQLMITSFRRS